TPDSRGCRPLAGVFRRIALLHACEQGLVLGGYPGTQRDSGCAALAADSYSRPDKESWTNLQAVAWHKRRCVRGTPETRFGSALWMKRVTMLPGPYRSTISVSRSSTETTCPFGVVVMSQ